MGSLQKEVIKRIKRLKMMGEKERSGDACGGVTCVGLELLIPNPKK